MSNIIVSQHGTEPPYGPEPSNDIHREVKAFFRNQAMALAMDKATTTFLSLGREEEDKGGSVEGRGITVHPPVPPTPFNAPKQSLTYSYAFRNPDGEERYIDVKIQIQATDVFVRPDKDTLPPWITEPVTEQFEVPATWDKDFWERPYKTEQELNEALNKWQAYVPSTEAAI